MRKIIQTITYGLLLSFMFSPFCFSQVQPERTNSSIPYFECFTGVPVGEIPEGWTRDIDNWGVNNTNNAGGEQPEMRLHYLPSQQGEFYLTSPPINTSGYEILQLKFKNFVNDDHGGYTIRVVSIVGTEEYLIEQWEVEGNIPAHEFSATLTSEDHGIGSEELQLAWVFEGNTWDMYWWNFDDIYLGEKTFELPFSEDFTGVDEDEIPPGWSKDSDNWGVSNTNSASGEPPEMQFDYLPGQIGRFYLTTPMINTTGVEALELSYKNYLNHFSGPYTLSVVTIANGEEHLIEEWVNPEDMPAEKMIFNLTDISHGVGADEFQLAWVFDGDPWNLNWWRFDDINLEEKYLISHTITFEVKEDSPEQDPIEGAVINIDTEQITTNHEGKAFIKLYQDFTYTAYVSAEGYEDQEVTFTVTEEETIEVFMTDIIIPPFNLNVVTTGLDPGEALFSWNFRNDNKGQYGSRGFVGFNVFLNSKIVATEIQEHEFLLENVPMGTNTAGVQSVYTTGVSDTVEIDFEMPQWIFTVTFDVKDVEGNEITDAIITWAGEVFPPGHYVFEDVIKGIYNYVVEKEGYNTKGGQVNVNKDMTIEIILEPETYTVTFDVKDEQGTPIEDAVITFDGETYPPGHYVFEDLIAGTYDYKVEKEGFYTVEDQVVVVHNVTVEVVMIVETFTVTFDVIDEFGDPITDAVVTFDGVTNLPGNYVFTYIEVGTYDYKVEKDGYIPVQDQVEVKDDITIEVTLYVAHTVTFTVSDEEGVPITDAVVTFDGVQNPPGDYVFEYIKAGTYDYKVEKEGYHTVEDQVTVEQDTHIDVTMILKTYTVTFNVVDTDNNPIPDAQIIFDFFLYPPGYYVFEDIPPGSYEYHVFKTDFKTVSGVVQVIDDDVTITVVLKTGEEPDEHTVTFNVSDVDNVPIEDALLVFDGNDYYTDSNGQVIIEDVKTGVYNYTVAKEGYSTVDGMVVVVTDVTENVTMYIETFTLTLAADPITGGTVSGEGEYEEGEQVTISASPNPGWNFTEWTGDTHYVDNPHSATATVTMPSNDISLTANFVSEPDTHTLALYVDPPEGGNVDGGGNYKPGEIVDITATPIDIYWEFEYWSGDVQHIDDPQSASAIVTMPDTNISLTANFKFVSVEDIPDIVLSVYPNPARNKFYVESSEMIKQIRLIDISGQVIKDIAVDALNTEINVNNFQTGIYFMQIYTGESVMTKRVQITR